MVHLILALHLHYCLCNRKTGQEFKDYPCNTFTFAKQYDCELPSADNSRTSPSGLFATGNSHALTTSVSGHVLYLDKNTLPVRWESPDVIESNPGRRWTQQLYFDHDRSHFGPEKSYNWAMKVESETVEMASRRLHSLNHCSCPQIAAMASHNADTSSVVSKEELRLPVSLHGDRVMSNSYCTLTDEICLQIVDEAFRDIEYMIV